MTSFEYQRPRSLEQAWELFERTPEARYVAGGTDVMVKIRQKRMNPRALVSLRNVPELSGIDASGTLRIGAATPLSDVIVHIAHACVRERIGVLGLALRSMGSDQIRNVATLGGNLVNASPCADSAPALVVLGARVLVAGPKGTREIAVEDLLTAPGATLLAPSEIITTVIVDPPAEGARATFMKKSRVSMDLAIANVAVQIELDAGVFKRARICAGAVGPTPLRLRRVEELLVGRRIAPDLVEEARRIARESVSPISDIRASADYRRAIVGAFVGRAIAALAGEKP